MAFIIDQKREYIKWFEYLEDKEEQYKLKFMSQEEYEKVKDLTDQEYFKVLEKYVLDWKGIIDTEGNKIKCTKETKLALFNNDIEGMKRVDFIGLTILQPRKFYDFGENLKN